jgi:hypothetical protein
MKVTTIIPDDILDDIQKYARGRNITDCLIMVLKDWLYVKRLSSLNDEVSKNPLCFKDGFSIDEIRNSNRS